MDAIELLKSQHREVAELFKKIELAEGEEKEDIFDQIADALAVHAAIEEKEFYPATRSARTDDLLREAVEEHLGVKRIIADLLECDSADPQFDAKIKVLKENVEHHVAEEENELFPKVKKLLDKQTLLKLGEIMEETGDAMDEEGSPRDNVPSETDAPAPIG
jgi:hemerythrin superfamily protein